MSFILKPLTLSTCKKLAEMRLSEAKLLLKNHQNSGAFYLAGYAIEMGLKACYCKNVGKYNFPPERAIYDKLYTHDLNGILSVCGIKSAFDLEIVQNPNLQSSWDVIKDWSEKTRYQVIKRSFAKSMVDSVIIVFSWIKTVW